MCSLHNVELIVLLERFVPDKLNSYTVRFLQQNLRQRNVLSSFCFALEVKFPMQFAVKQEIAPCKESGILGFGIRNTAQGICGIPLTIEIRESKNN